MVGRTVQGVAEQVSGQGGPGDQVVERRVMPDEAQGSR